MIVLVSVEAPVVLEIGLETALLPSLVAVEFAVSLVRKTDNEVTGACACHVRIFLPPASKSKSLHFPSAPTMIARVRKPGKNAAPVMAMLLLPTFVLAEASGGSDMPRTLVTWCNFAKWEISPE